MRKAIHNFLWKKLGGGRFPYMALVVLLIIVLLILELFGFWGNFLGLFNGTR